LRAHVHDAFGNGGGVDYSPPNECEEDNKDNEEEEDEEGGGGGGVTKNSSHPSFSTGMIAAGDEGESKATHGGADDNEPAADAYAISAMISIEKLEEEVAMRESTLGSLASKLERQRNKISTEEQTLSSLRDGVRYLEERQSTHERQWRKNKGLVGVLEALLGRCTDRRLMRM
jgi:hypothetical protein